MLAIWLGQRMQFDWLKRREFITLLGGATVAWPIMAHAQQAAVPVVGYIDAGSPEPAAQLVSAFCGGLGEIGSVEGRNVALGIVPLTRQPSRREGYMPVNIGRREFIAALGSAA
jgi:hypothetical protein